MPGRNQYQSKKHILQYSGSSKFLKSDTTELGHITDIIERYALAYPSLHFIYRHNDLDILNCPADNDLKTTVFHVFGKKDAKFMESVNYSDDDNEFKIRGLLGHPQIARKNRNISSLYINNRYVISDVLFRAIKEAYEGTLMIGKHPFFILFLEINPSGVDFNVHPKKLHIRFENETSIYNRVYNSIKSFVEEYFIEKEAKYISTDLDYFIPDTEVEPPVLEIESEQQPEEKTEKIEIKETTIQLNLTDDLPSSKTEGKQIPKTVMREKFITAKNFPKLKLISQTGQLSNKIYVVLEGHNEETDEDGLYILDQHAASERINKEKFLNAYESSKISRQQLIFPLQIDVTASEKFFLEENLDEINKLGFVFEHFGGNTFVLREIPTIMEKLPKIEIVREIIEDITDIGKDRSFIEVKEDIINYLSCHKSIRGGDDLSLKDIRVLLLNLANCKDPYHCAHGRPTLRFFSFKELDKLFKRIV